MSTASSDPLPVEQHGCIGHPAAPVPWPLPRLPRVKEHWNTPQQHRIHHTLSADSVARRHHAERAVPIERGDLRPPLIADPTVGWLRRHVLAVGRLGLAGSDDGTAEGGHLAAARGLFGSRRRSMARRGGARCSHPTAPAQPQHPYESWTGRARCGSAPAAWRRPSMAARPTIADTRPPR